MAGHHLSKFGIKRGDRLGLCLSNSPEMVIICLGALQLGVIIVPINPRFPIVKINQLLEIASCKIVVKDSSEKNFKPVEMTGKFKVISIKDVIYLDADTLSEYRKYPLKNIMFNWQQDATVIFTSGSSGNAKGVLHTFKAHWDNALGANRNIPFCAGDRWIASLPMFHVGGLALLFRALSGGGALVFADDEPLEDVISDLLVTHVSMVATNLFRILKGWKVAIKILSPLKCLLLGGGPVPEDLIMEASQKKLPLFITYGSTEMASQVTTTQIGAQRSDLLTAGKVLPGRQIKISQEGEILLKGDTLFRGYVKKYDILQPFDKSGWFRSGDTGYINQYGNLIVKGRRDNMFVTGGENIHPEEVEKSLLSIKNVEAAVVVPIKNSEFGTQSAAFIKAQKVDFNVLRKELVKKLARYQVPELFFPWPEKLKDSGIKPDRSFFVKLVEELK